MMQKKVFCSNSCEPKAQVMYIIIQYRKQKEPQRGGGPKALGYFVSLQLFQ